MMKVLRHIYRYNKNVVPYFCNAPFLTNNFIILACQKQYFVPKCLDVDGNKPDRFFFQEKAK